MKTKGSPTDCEEVQASHIEQHEYTVQYRDNAVNFLPNIHNDI